MSVLSTGGRDREPGCCVIRGIAPFSGTREYQIEDLFATLALCPVASRVPPRFAAMRPACRARFRGKENTHQNRDEFTVIVHRGPLEADNAIVNGGGLDLDHQETQDQELGVDKNLGVDRTEISVSDSLGVAAAVGRQANRPEQRMQMRSNLAGRPGGRGPAVLLVKSGDFSHQSFSRRFGSRRWRRVEGLDNRLTVTMVRNHSHVVFRTLAQASAHLAAAVATVCSSLN